MGRISETLSGLLRELPPNVKLVAVSKFHPVSSIMEAYDAGQRIFGESRPQEFKEKAEKLPSDIVWHFIGHLQTNKLKMVLPYAAVVESVDSVRLLASIDRWSADNGKKTDVFLEVHIASEETKQGFTEEEVLDVLRSASSYPAVRILGLMGMATYTDDKEIVRTEFSRLVALRNRILEDSGLASQLPDFGLLSFGMSNDYRIAAEMGADYVRIGTLIFGEREYNNQQTLS